MKIHPWYSFEVFGCPCNYLGEWYGFNDFGQIVKYTHFSILLLLFLLHRYVALTEYAVSLKIVKRSLKYFYPGLKLFKTLGKYKMWIKIAAF